MEDCILHTLAVYSYVQEHLAAEATRHQVVLQKTGVLIVLAQDALRGLYGAQCELSPVTAACLCRNILETRCNLLFIYRSGDPEKWADRFHRYMGVERLLHDQHRPDGVPAVVPDAERREIPRRAPEWFGADGKVAVLHWTADKKLKSLKALAKAVGLQADYHQIYGIGSKFMHGSALLRNLYARGNALGSVTKPEVCTQMAALATGLAMRMLRETVDFYGAQSFDDDYVAWQKRWLRFYQQTDAVPRRGAQP
ncbi:MAG: hypothetical protein HYZ28_16380 [Myxococcales bacterium]|nr:hypothetical protein [Myxococcales bacterium]